MSTKAHPDYGSAPEPNEWKLRLYVTDWTPRCVVAFKNIQQICHEHVKDTKKVVSSWTSLSLF